MKATWPHPTALTGHVTGPNEKSTSVPPVPLRMALGGDVGGTGYVSETGIGMTMSVPSHSLPVGSCPCQTLA